MKLKGPRTGNTERWHSDEIFSKIPQMLIFLCWIRICNQISQIRFQSPATGHWRSENNKMTFSEKSWKCHFYTSNTRIGLGSNFSVFNFQNRFLRYLKHRKSCLHRFSTECHFYTSNTRIGLGSDFSVFNFQNRFLRYLKHRKSCLHRFSTECHFYTSNTRIG